MKTLLDIKTSTLADAMGWSTSYASQVKTGVTKVSARLARAINEKFGIPLWDIRPDIYPRHLFEANDASNHNNQPQSNNNGAHEQ